MSLYHIAKKKSCQYVVSDQVVEKRKKGYNESMNYGKSKVATSQMLPFFLERFEKFGNSLSGREFWEKHVQPDDSDIPYKSWERFAKTLREKVQVKADKIMAKITDNKVTEIQLEKGSLKKILAIADLTLDEIIEKPEILNSIPVKDRMGWLFSAMKARDSRTNIMIKAKEEDRKTTMYEDVLKGAQYGAIDAGQVDDQPQPAEMKSDVKFSDIMPEPRKVVKVIEAPETPLKKVEFNPNQL